MITTPVPARLRTASNAARSCVRVGLPRRSFNAFSPSARQVLSPPLAGRFEARIVGEFKPNAAWFPYDEMDLRSFPGQRRSEFHGDVRPTRDAFVQRIQSWAISHGQREVVQTYIGAAVKRDGAWRRLDLP